MTKPLNKPPSNKPKISQKKIEKAGIKGSKVVFTNTHESKALLELTIECDRLFRSIRDSVDFNQSAANLIKGRTVICGLSDFLKSLSVESGHNYIEPAIIAELKRTIG